MAMYDIEIKLKTMSNKHPLSPPPLAKVKEWIVNNNINTISVLEASAIATAASRWGWDERGAAIEKELQEARDQELDECCGFIACNHSVTWSKRLRAARRPKPLSLKEQKQTELNRLIALISKEGALAMAEPIRQALEKLKALEQLDD